VTREPPRLAERLVRWSLAREERTAVLGDLAEEFGEELQHAGDRAARRWYWRQTITSVAPNVVRRIRNDEDKRFLRGLWLLIIWTPWIGGETWKAWHSVSLVVLALAGLAAFLTLSPVFGRHPRQAQVRVLRPLFVLFAATWLVRGLYPAPTLVAIELKYLLAPAAVLLFAVLLWPWWPPDPPLAEFFVRPRPAPDQDPLMLLTLTVPNLPLGLSGLVVSRARANAAPSTGASPSGVLYLEPTIDRAFDRGSVLRVCAALKTSGAPARVICEVLDDAGNAVRTLSPPILFEDFERLAKPWDIKPAEDPAPLVGRIDITLPLTDLAPGEYRVRVTTTDGAHAAQQEEHIVVREPTKATSPLP